MTGGDIDTWTITDRPGLAGRVQPERKPAEGAHTRSQGARPSRFSAAPRKLPRGAERLPRRTHSKNIRFGGITGERESMSGAPDSLRVAILDVTTDTSAIYISGGYVVGTCMIGSGGGNVKISRQNSVLNPCIRSVGFDMLRENVRAGPVVVRPAFEDRRRDASVRGTRHRCGPVSVGQGPDSVSNGDQGGRRIESTRAIGGGDGDSRARISRSGPALAANGSGRGHGGTARPSGRGHGGTAA